MIAPDPSSREADRRRWFPGYAYARVFNKGVGKDFGEGLVDCRREIVIVGALRGIQPINRQADPL
jgi:hypothetical protein